MKNITNVTTRKRRTEKLSIYHKAGGTRPFKMAFLAKTVKYYCKH